MFTLLSALYDLLSFITEDAVANKLFHVPVPKEIMDMMNELCIKLGDYLNDLD